MGGIDRAGVALSQSPHLNDEEQMMKLVRRPRPASPSQDGFHLLAITPSRRRRRRWTETEFWMYLVRVMAAMSIAAGLGLLVPSLSTAFLVMGGLLCLGEAVL
jgi:hypothetical protein